MADDAGRRTRRGVEIVSDDDLGIFDPATIEAPGGGSDDGGANAGGAGRDDDGFDPAIHVARTSRNADGSYRRKRGVGAAPRQSGGGERARTGRPRAASSRLDITGVQAVLYSIHAGVAGVMQNPVWMIEEGEAAQLGKALIEVERQYPTRIDPRALAWINLLGVAGAIYGPRILASLADIKARRDAARAGQRPAPTRSVGLGIPDNPPQPRPADVTPPGGPTQPGGTTYTKVPDGLVDLEALAAAQAQLKR